MSRITVGGYEKVDVPGLDLTDVVAKIDTGAYSGAIHCTNITRMRVKGTNTLRLRFDPLGNKALRTTADTFYSTNVRSATGHRVKRYLIDTEIVLGATTYPIRIGLFDRSDMQREILIGRRFLKENNMLVDVTVNDHYDEGES